MSFALTLYPGGSSLPEPYIDTYFLTQVLHFDLTALDFKILISACLSEKKKQNLKLPLRKKFLNSVIFKFLLFSFFNSLSVCSCVVLLSRGTYLHVRMSEQFFTSGGGVQESSNNCHYGDSIFLCLVVIINCGWAKVINFTSVFICHLKHQLISFGLDKPTSAIPRIPHAR